MPFRKDFIKEHKKVSVKLRFSLQSPGGNDIFYYKIMASLGAFMTLILHRQTDRQTDRFKDL